MLKYNEKMSTNKYIFSKEELDSFKNNMIGENDKIILFFTGYEAEVKSDSKY